MSRAVAHPAPLQRLKALADENRLRILMQLAGGERCVCDLTDALEAGQSLLSFHLRTLRDAGLVTCRRDGRWVHYSLSTEGLAELEAFLRSMRETAATAAPSSGACCD
jgi:ArsR family transcriptional regulator